MEKIIKICGNNCNCNLDIIHTRKLLNYLFVEFRQSNGYDIILNEIIAGFSFALLGDFDCILQEETSLKEDKEKTIQNIDKLNNYLYGGYRNVNN